MMIFTLKKHYIGKKILSFIKFIGFEFTCCVKATTMDAKHALHYCTGGVN